jgi:hypothetical protein
MEPWAKRLERKDSCGFASLGGAIVGIGAGHDGAHLTRTGFDCRIRKSTVRRLPI